MVPAAPSPGVHLTPPTGGLAAGGPSSQQALPRLQRGGKAWLSREAEAGPGLQTEREARARVPSQRADRPERAGREGSRGRSDSVSDGASGGHRGADWQWGHLEAPRPKHAAGELQCVPERRPEAVEQGVSCWEPCGARSPPCAVLTRPPAPCLSQIP